MNQRNKRILILVPGKDARGGINNYYYSIHKEFTLPIDYLYRGSRTYPYRKSILTEVYRMIGDYLSFFVAVLSREYELIQTSTSFDSYSLLRDTIFILIAKLLRLKVIVFVRGWDVELEKKNNNALMYRVLKKIFFLSDVFIVLSNAVKKSLKAMGCQKEIFVETTLVDSKLLTNYSSNLISLKYKNIDEFKILFLSRIEVTKGIFEMVTAFKILEKEYPKLKLIIAGDGTEENRLKEFIKANKISNVQMPGFVQNQAKTNAYRNAHLFIFPSYHGEGMPNSVLEAMAFGLPVICTSVGGLIDFFKDGENGIVIRIKNEDDIINAIRYLIDKKDLMLRMGINNYEYAKKNFTSDIVARRLENIYLKTLNYN